MLFLFFLVPSGWLGFVILVSVHCAIPSNDLVRWQYFPARSTDQVTQCYTCDNTRTYVRKGSACSGFQLVVLCEMLESLVASFCSFRICSRSWHFRLGGSWSESARGGLGGTLPRHATAVTPPALPSKSYTRITVWGMNRPVESTVGCRSSRYTRLWKD